MLVRMLLPIGVMELKVIQMVLSKLHLKAGRNLEDTTEICLKQDLLTQVLQLYMAMEVSGLQKCSNKRLQDEINENNS